MPIIDSPEKEQRQSANLLDWLLPKLEQWKQYRDTNYKQKWDEYYRLWRGIWVESDATRKSERCKLVSPALQQAIESSVAEIEEATFGRGVWFDIRDDVADPEPLDVESLVTRLKEDLEGSGCIDSLQDIILMAALYGTGIGEIIITDKEHPMIIELPVTGTFVTKRDRVIGNFFEVRLNPILPSQFIIDPTAKTVNDAMGVAIEEMVPKHIIVEGIQQNYYNKVIVGSFSDIEDRYALGEQGMDDSADKVKLTRYYGRVPKIYLQQAENLKKPTYITTIAPEEWKDPEWELVEAIVIIANDQVILKATENPYLMQDRPVVAFQWDRVPKRFFGRGVAEKGYNAQKALDAELRARIDALGLISHPMMGIDATRLPRGMRFEVAPGKTILTNGPPGEVLSPINFGTLNPSTFTQSGEMERMVQVGTGAIDSAAPIGMNPRNNTSGGMSMMMGAAIKRQKRNLLGFQNNFLIPFIEKAFWRFQQFDPIRYPVADVKFRATGTLGLMAREFEQQQFIQLLSITPPDSKMFPVVMKGILDNSSVQNRTELMQALVQAAQPDPQKQQLEMMEAQARIEQLQADAAYKRGQLEGIKIKGQVEMMKIQAENQPKENPDFILGLQKLQTDVKVETLKLALDEKKIDNDTALRTKELEIEAAKVAVQEKGISVNAQSQAIKLDERIAKLIEKLSKPRIFERDNNGEVVRIRLDDTDNNEDNS